MTPSRILAAYLFMEEIWKQAATAQDPDAKMLEEYVGAIWFQLTPAQRAELLRRDTAHPLTPLPGVH